MLVHEKFGILSSDKNLFRIHSLNNIKLLKEYKLDFIKALTLVRKDKLKAKLLRDLRNTKYKEREIQAIPTAAQSHRMRSMQSERTSHYEVGPETMKAFENLMDTVPPKEETKETCLNKIKEVLSKPILKSVGNKAVDYKTHVKRLDGLKKLSQGFEIQHVNTVSYHNL